MARVEEAKRLFASREGGGVAAFRRRQLSSLLDSSKIFDFASWIPQSLTAEADRSVLRHRLNLKLSGVRRGRLRLPKHFPPEVRGLQELSNAQLLDKCYYVVHRNNGLRPIPDWARDLVHRVYPDGQLLTCNRDVSVHIRQKSMAKPCSKSDWPRLGTRSAWPSTPTLIESVEMARRGLTPSPIIRNVEPAQCRISLAQFNSLVGLRSRVINSNIVGIRSTVRVPDKYIGYFRYRWEFLILNCGYRIPDGLVRFLTSVWIREPHNLWLRSKCSFKNFLKKSDYRDFISAVPGPW